MHHPPGALQREKWVPREEALGYCRLVKNGNNRVLLVQARAGQGKTTLAEQFAQEFPGPVCWCACSRSETDHIALLETLCMAMADAVNGFDPSGVLGAARSSLTPEEAIAAVTNGLPGAFGSCPSQQVLTVVDDVHLLNSAPASLAMLRAFVESCPDTVTFAVLTRTPLQLDGSPLFTFFKTVRIDDATLALSGAEIAQIHETVHGRELSSDECAAILLATEGWTTGALLMGISDKGGMPGSTTESLSLYFWETCLAGAPRSAVTAVLQMALLEEVPTGMIQALDLDDGAQLAEDLAARNLFVRVTQGRNGLVYRFHHLFRDALRHMCRSEMPEAQQTDFLKHAAQWYIDNGDAAEGLRCLAATGHWEELVRGVRQHGMPLISTNHLRTLDEILSRCPEDVLRSSGWFLLVLGRVRIMAAPQQGFELLRQAHRRFVAQGDTEGELMALVFLAFGHLFITGRLRSFIKTLPRARELFGRHSDGMAPMTRVTCAFVLSLAHTYGPCDLVRGERFAQTARQTLGDMGLDQTTPELELISQYRGGLSGELEQSLQYLEPQFRRLNAAEVCPSTRLSVSTAYANFRLMHGDIRAYEQCRDEIAQDFADIIQHSFLGGFYRIWDADVQLARGEIKAAADTAAAILEHPTYGHYDHLRSQAHQYLALTGALLGRGDAALDHARQSARIRAATGGWFFIRLNHAVVGGTFALCGEHRLGERALSKAIKYCRELDDCYLVPQALAYRAWSRLEQGNRAGALQDIDAMLEQMSRQGNTHFFYREPGMMQRLLGEAEANGIRLDAVHRLEEAWFPPEGAENASSSVRKGLRALECMKHDLPWSAHLYFSSMLKTFDPGKASSMDREVVRRAIVSWTGLLRETHQPAKALAVAERGVGIFPECPELLALKRALETKGCRN